MAKRANRGCGRKKNSKLLVQEASVALEDASHSLDCDAELSEAKEICESLDCEVVISELDAQRPAGSVSAIKLAINGVEVISATPEMVVLRNPGFSETKREPTVVVPVEKLDQKNLA